MVQKRGIDFGNPVYKDMEGKVRNKSKEKSRRKTRKTLNKIEEKLENKIEPFEYKKQIDYGSSQN